MVEAREFLGAGLQLHGHKLAAATIALKLILGVIRP